MVLRESVPSASTAFGHQYQPPQPAATDIQGIRLRASYQQAWKHDKDARPYVLICMVFFLFLTHKPFCSDAQSGDIHNVEFTGDKTDIEYTQLLWKLAGS
jgi:hypothetical protein